MKSLQPRDGRGRFTKAKPKAPPPLPEALVKSLGQGRRPFEMTAEQDWELAVFDEQKWREALNGGKT